MTKRCFTYGSDGGLETFATEIAARFERLTLRSRSRPASYSRMPTLGMGIATRTTTITG